MLSVLAKRLLLCVFGTVVPIRSISISYMSCKTLSVRLLRHYRGESAPLLSTHSSTVLGSRFSVLVTDCRSTSSLLPSRIRSTTFPCLVCVCRSAFSLLPSRARSTTFTCNGGVYLCPHGMWGRDTRLPGWVVVPYIKTQFNMTCVAFGLTSGFGF